MREQLIFEAEPFEFDSEFDEYEEEQADSYAEFDSEEEFDTERAEEEWQEEVNRNSQAYIRWVQSALNKILGLRLAVDGLMGTQTRSAIRSFQQRQRLTADGVVDPQTEAALIAAGGGSPPGASSTPGGSSACPPRPTFVDCPPPVTPFEVLDNFAFDGFQLNRPLHTPRIIKIAQHIIASQKSAQPIRSLLIAGHTDPVGNDDYNFRLSRQRAETAMRELCTTLERMSPGLAGRIKFQVTPCGERQPKTKPELSRRVEVFLPKQVTPPPQRGCPPFKERIRLHLKILVEPTRFTIATMLQSMRQVYGPAGFLVEVASRETLRLPALEDLDLLCPGSTTQVCCPFPCATNTLNPEHVALFQRRNNVRVNEVAVYFVRRTVPGLNGCCAHPPGRPGVVVSATASQWTLGHEVGHVLGLQHINNSDRLMTGGGTNNITNPPPDLIAREIQTMTQSSLTVPC